MLRHHFVMFMLLRCSKLVFHRSSKSPIPSKIMLQEQAPPCSPFFTLLRSQESLRSAAIPPADRKEQVPKCNASLKMRPVFLLLNESKQLLWQICMVNLTVTNSYDLIFRCTCFVTYNQRWRTEFFASLNSGCSVVFSLLGLITETTYFRTFWVGKCSGWYLPGSKRHVAVSQVKN